MPDRPAPLTRADFPVFRRITTRWNDEDVYGHVNNAAYYSFFDTAVNGYLIEATGTDIRALPAVGLVVETGCVYRRELGYPAPVDVGLAVDRLGTSSIVYRLGLFQGHTDEAAAEGRFVHVYVDQHTREVTPVPDRIREVVAPLQRGG
ncbi:MAG TPA: thioesterase family protein [Nocardioidaceae bacterium]|nr:thioesterase family protein [Nocardioidaceae bacterium]